MRKWQRRCLSRQRETCEVTNPTAQSAKVCFRCALTWLKNLPTGQPDCTVCQGSCERCLLTEVPAARSAFCELERGVFFCVWLQTSHRRVTGNCARAGCCCFLMGAPSSRAASPPQALPPVVTGVSSSAVSSQYHAASSSETALLRHLCCSHVHDHVCYRSTGNV